MMKQVACLIVFFGSVEFMSAQDSSGASEATASFSPVTWERLVNAADEPENWLMYS